MFDLDAELERREREKFDFQQLSEPEQAKIQFENLLRYKVDRWAFLKECVYTKDQVDKVRPIKPYPSHLRYLELLVYLWEVENQIAVPKSRRMTASWTYISLYTHDAIFYPQRHIAFVSKKEEDSYELVKRAEHIYMNIPEWRLPRFLLPKIKGGEATKKPPKLTFEDNGSVIQGFPQGEDQLRQFTLSGILEDEAAFWEEAEGSYAGAKPTTDGGGRLTIVSSRAPSFFKKIVYDQLDAQDYNFPEIPPVDVKHPLPGVEVWKNPKNNFLVIDLHYSAHPDKQSKEWRDAVKGGMPIRKFLMEYEKTWETYEGKPVYEDFVKGVHSTTELLRPVMGLPFIVGIDFGLTPAMILCQLVESQLRVYKEYIGIGGIRKLAKEVMADFRLRYTPWVSMENMIYAAIDPAGFQRSQVDERTCVQELMACGFTNILPGPIDWESRRLAVEGFLTSYSKQGPGLLVSEAGCPTLVKGFNGGYRYPDKVKVAEPNDARPLKDMHSHPHDGLQYAAHIANTKQVEMSKIILTTPGYGFQKGQHG